MTTNSQGIAETGATLAAATIAEAATAAAMPVVAAFMTWGFVSISAFAAGIATLSDEDAREGLEQVLAQGATAAVSKLGVMNGFLHDPRVKIPLPGSLEKGERAMRALGMKKYANGLILAMNRAAERAVVEAKPLLLEAVQNVTGEDAEAILRAGDDAATQHFRNQVSEALAQKLLPIVKSAMDEGGMVNKYNEFARKAAKLGLVAEKNADLENYVTQKTLDGIYIMMSEEERAMREDPMSQGSKLLERVFESEAKQD